MSDQRVPVNLVFQGGGVKGIALVGALDSIWPFVRPAKCIGTSAGAIVACLTCAGYSPVEIRRILEEESLGEIVGISRVGWFLSPLTALRRGALFDATPISQWVDRKLRLKLGKRIGPNGVCRFRDLPIPLTVVATDLRSGGAIFFDRERTPESHVASAVMYSSSIPYLFVAQEREGARLVDGGLVWNFALSHFDRDRDGVRTLGLALEGRPIEEDRRSSFVSQLVGAITTRRGVAIGEDDRARVIAINTGPVATAEFGISLHEQRYLFQQGQAAGREFMTEFGRPYGLPSGEAVAVTEDPISDQRIDHIRRVRRVLDALRAILVLGAICFSGWTLSRYAKYAHERYAVTTYAGTALPGIPVNTDRRHAQFRSPSGVAVDQAGRVIVADAYNNAIRVIESDGGVYTYGQGVFNDPFDVAVDKRGVIYVADLYFHVIRSVTVNWVARSATINVVAGAVGEEGGSTGPCPCDQARFSAPMGLALCEGDGFSILFVADSGNSAVRWIDLTNGTVHALIVPPEMKMKDGDDGNEKDRQDGAIEFALDYPQDVKCVTRNGVTALFIADTFKHRIVRVDLRISVGDKPRIDCGQPLEFATEGALYGTAGNLLSLMKERVGLPPMAVPFLLPYHLAVDGAGDLYISDYGNGIIWKIDDPFDKTTGTASHVAGGPGVRGRDGYVNGWGTRARFSRPNGLAIDGSGRIYVADDYNHCIRLIEPRPWGVGAPAVRNAATGEERREPEP